MAERNDGIDLMRRRMERAQRVPPAARRPAAAPQAPTPAAEGETTTQVPVTEAAPPATPVRRTPPRRATSSEAVPGASRRPRVEPGDPPVNLAIRVRRPLDEHLVDLLHELRKAGVRSSKVELIEMLLWELPADTAAVRTRLAEFRRAAPRGGDGA